MEVTKRNSRNYHRSGIESYLFFLFCSGKEFWNCWFKKNIFLPPPLCPLLGSWIIYMALFTHKSEHFILSELLVSYGYKNYTYSSALESLWNSSSFSNCIPLKGYQNSNFSSLLHFLCIFCLNCLSHRECKAAPGWGCQQFHCVLHWRPSRTSCK